MIGVGLTPWAMRRRKTASASNWWELLVNAEGAWEAALAADQASSYTDLTGNGHTLLPILGTPTWSAGVGWGGFLADTCALYTGIDAPGEDKAIMVQFAAVTNSAARCVMGCAAPLAGNTAFNIYPVSPSSNTKRMYVTAGASSEMSSQQSTATMALCGGQPYLNGAPDGSAISTGTGTQSPISIGAGLRRTAAQGGYALESHVDGSIKRAVVWLNVPAGSQILALHEAWASLG